MESSSHVVPGGLDPAVGALDVSDAERVDAAVEGSAVALTRAQAFLDLEVLPRQLDRALDHPNQVEVQTLEPATAQLAWTKTTSGPSPS
jgi:hypothetical protein